MNDLEYFKDITNRCERKYEYLLDKLALFQSENKKDKFVRGVIKNGYIFDSISILS